jgi:hypothetical protein
MKRQPKNETKYQNYYDHEDVATTNPPPKTDDDYILVDTPQSKPIREDLPPDEITLRQLKAQFKGIFGYKPVGMLAEEIDRRIKETQKQELKK